MSGWSHTGGYYTGQVNANKSALLEKMNGMNIKGKRIALTLKGYTSSANRGIAWVINYTDNSTEELRMEGTTQGTWTIVSNQNKTVDHLSLSYGSGTTIDYYSAIQIEIGSVATEVVPFGTLDTLSLPSSVTLRSAGSVADELELNVEVNGVDKRRLTKKVVEVAFSDLTADSYSAGSVNCTCRFALSDNTVTTLISSYPEAQLSSPSLSITTSYWSYQQASGIESASVTNTFTFDPYGTYVRVYLPVSGSITDADSFVAALGDLSMTYELATYSETLSEPIINNTIATEGGGTINTVQTQTPVIDNSMDVGYLAL